MGGIGAAPISPIHLFSCKYPGCRTGVLNNLVLLLPAHAGSLAHDAGSLAHDHSLHVRYPARSIHPRCGGVLHGGHVLHGAR